MPPTTVLIVAIYLVTIGALVKRRQTLGIHVRAPALGTHVPAGSNS